MISIANNYELQSIHSYWGTPYLCTFSHFCAFFFFQMWHILITCFFLTFLKHDVVKQCKCYQ